MSEYVYVVVVGVCADNMTILLQPLRFYSEGSGNEGSKVQFATEIVNVIFLVAFVFDLYAAKSG